MLTVKGHFVDDIRKVALKFNISTHFIQMFTFEKSSVRCVVRSFFTDIKLQNFVSLHDLFAKHIYVLVMHLYGFCIISCWWCWYNVWLCGWKQQFGISNTSSDSFFISRVVCKFCFCLQWNLLLENFYLYVKCSAVWNGRIREGSFGMDMTFLLRTLFNGLRFSEFAVLRTSDTDTWHPQRWQSRFDLSRVGELLDGQHPCL
jgi:hypothetical protein